MVIVALVNVSNVNGFLQLVTIDEADLCGVCTDLRTGVPLFCHAGSALADACTSVSELYFSRADAGLV